MTRTIKPTLIRQLALMLIAVIILTCAVSCGRDEPPLKYEDIPAYSGQPYVEINGNVPFFTRDELVVDAYERYSHLDVLGRCGVAIACIGREIMPTEEREGLSSVNPTGLIYNGKSNNNQYSFIDNGYLYNRCHLIGFQLAGENANEKNLITGTRYFNIEGMLPFENMVADHVKGAGGHVMLRVTPYYVGYDFVARGVLMEGYSVEDNGESVCFCVFVYNVQPGVIIDYYTGENRLDMNSDYSEEDVTVTLTYVLNKNSRKYHLPDCYHAKSMKAEYRIEYDGSVAAFENVYPSYTPCGSCKPNEYK